jgi:hypothetical protein
LGKPVSAIIRDAVDEYIADPPMYMDIREVPYSYWARAAKMLSLDRSDLRESTRYSKVIVLRLPTEELRRWKLVAHAFRTTVSTIIRRAVRHHLRADEAILRALLGQQ